MSKTEIIREVNGLRFYKKGDTYYLSKIADGTLRRYTFTEEGAKDFMQDILPTSDVGFRLTELLLIGAKASGNPNYYEVKLQ